MRLSDRGGPIPRPGQFYMLSAHDGWAGGSDGRPFLPRALSYMRHRPETDELEFLLEVVGPGTARLAELRAGERVWLTGPLGVGFEAPADEITPVLVGGGIGIVPLVAWHQQLRLNDRDPALLLGFRDASHAAAARLLGEAEMTITTDDGSLGDQGIVTAALARALAQQGRAAVYACGPPAMLDAVRGICARQGLDAQLALEAPMACGFGACFGCVVSTVAGYRRVCLDGPVFDAAVIADGALA